jgi:hypothetical protein
MAAGRKLLLLLRVKNTARSLLQSYEKDRFKK